MADSCYKQLISAIEIAYSPSSSQDLKQQAFDYVNAVRTNPSGWHPCLNIFTHDPPHSETIRFFCLEIVNHAVSSGRLDVGSLTVVKDSLLEHLRRVVGPQREETRVADSAAIQNKIAQSLTYLFSALYGSVWQSFFDDLLSLTGTSGRDNYEGVIFYLRVLNSISDEIGDNLLSRSKSEQERANTLKDLIRHRDVQKIALSWQEILAHWRLENDKVAEYCLKAIGKWVSWVDIGLVVNQQMLDLLFQQLGRAQTSVKGQEEARDAAVDVFTEITAKKMKAPDKLEMISFLNLENVAAQLIACPPLSDQKSSHYDTDLAETVAKLVNTAVTDIVRVLESEDIDNEIWTRAERLLQAFMPHLLRFFSDEFDEVCSTVLNATTDLLGLFRKNSRTGLRGPQSTVILLPILQATFRKMRYDESSAWGEDDDETEDAEFQDLRRRLHVLENIIAAADEQLYTDAVTGLVYQTFDSLRSQGSQLDWRDLELAFHEMYSFGDLCMKASGLYTKNKPLSRASECLIEMMLKLVEHGKFGCTEKHVDIMLTRLKDVRSFNHPATQLGYGEICVRYSSFFEHNTHLITPVLENFLQLTHSSHAKVRLRSWYLFQRFCRTLRSHIGNVAQIVVENMADLLVIKAELPSDDTNEDMSSEDRESTDTVFTSQLYLFEAIGCICGTSSVPVDKQVLFAQSVMNPIFVDMEQSLPAARSGDQRAVAQVHHDIMALGALARGFSDWMPGSTNASGPPPEKVQEAFAPGSEATLTALGSVGSSFDIRTAARNAFSRLLGVLGPRILPQLSRWIEGLLTQSSTRDEMALFLRLLEQVVFGFKTEVYNILDNLLTPFLERIFASLSSPSLGTDDEIQQNELKREYLNFLLVVLNNELGSVIVSSTNQAMFETIISSIEQFTKDADDYPTAKMAFQVLNRMVVVWGGPDVLSSTQPNGNTPAPTLPGFDQFMMARLSPLCWTLPASSSFNPKDAQARQVLQEAASLQKVIYLKTGPAYLAYLKDQELRNMGMGDPMIEEYLAKLTTFDIKDWRKYWTGVVTGAMGSI